MSIQQETIRQQQSFLEYIANKDRQGNLIITGLQESDKDDEGLENILRTVAPDIRHLEYNHKRLGNPETARSPRPILIERLNGSRNKRNTLCGKSNTLKSKPEFKKVFMKKDTHPIFRKEHNRLKKVVWEEKQKPTNQGCNILYDIKKGVVTKDDIVIDRFAINF